MAVAPGRGIRITGWGTALPDKIVTNADLEATLDTTDEWIVERTGIRERRVGGTTASLAAEAGAEALTRAGLTGADVDVVLVATSTPDLTMPATASLVHEQLGVRGGAFDLNAACSGFVYGLVVAAGLAAVGADHLLLIGSETMSRITDWDDRATAILFADGAGAVVVDAVEGPGDLLGHDLAAEDDTSHLLYTEHGGYLQMEGREVFRRAVRSTLESIDRCLRSAGLTMADVELFVPHQANIRIMEAMADRLDFDMSRVAVVLDRTGNTSSASIPLALAAAAADGRLRTGDVVLLAGFGAGMTAATALLRWGGEP
ncbi:MAG TPA: beta-ketoacyl-ACP synthase 3 [Acidimicrobiales bacterium]|nr:beta-ketoacyl-ACP synthase 3 [Acidimicrobiales bacterium]